MAAKPTLPRPGGRTRTNGDRPTDGYGWQRYVRELSISADDARRHKVDARTVKFALTMLSTYVGPDGTCDPGQDALRRQMAGMGERTLRRSLDALESAQIITVERHRKGTDPRTGKPYTNLYTFVFEGPATTMAAGHDYGRSGTGHEGGRDRPREGEGPAIQDGGTGHSYGPQTGRDERSSERSSETNAPAEPTVPPPAVPLPQGATAEEIKVKPLIVSIHRGDRP